MNTENYQKYLWLFLIRLLISSLTHYFMEIIYLYHIMLYKKYLSLLRILVISSRVLYHA